MAEEEGKRSKKWFPLGMLCCRFSRSCICVFSTTNFTSAELLRSNIDIHVYTMYDGIPLSLTTLLLSLVSIHVVESFRVKSRSDEYLCSKSWPRYQPLRVNNKLHSRSSHPFPWPMSPYLTLHFILHFICTLFILDSTTCWALRTGRWRWSPSLSKPLYSCIRSMTSYVDPCPSPTATSDVCTSFWLFLLFFSKKHTGSRRLL